MRRFCSGANTHRPYCLRPWCIVGWIAVGALGAIGYSAEPPAPDKGSVEPSGKFIPTRPTDEAEADGGAAALKNLNIEHLDNGMLRIGGVTLDQKTRTLRFQGKVQLTEGPVEYLVVTEIGKVHESVFVTKTTPRDIHLAMLLLGVKPGKVVPGPDRCLKIADTSAVVATVEWDTNGPRAVHPLGSMISLAQAAPDQDSGRTLKVDRWLYKGSSFDRGGFVAQREGSVISLIGDGAALINNPGNDRERDDLHVPNAKLLPRKGMPVTLVISVPGPSSEP